MDVALELGSVRWVPDLEHADGGVLHVCFDELDEPWRRRLTAAHENGRRTTLACDQRAITEDCLAFMQGIDASLFLIDTTSGDIGLQAFDSVADLVAGYDLALDKGALQRLGEQRLVQALAAADSYRKGRYFEEVLCLLFSQVGYFRVLEHRYLNETEEIDLVLGNRAVGHMAGLIGGPLVVVSAKNHAAPIGAPEVRALWGNMTKRRGRCQLGFLCSARRLASTARSERLHATTDPTLAVALLDGGQIRALLRSDDLDADMERHIRAAVLE